MALPYPLEVETGDLRAPPARRRPPLPIGRLVEQAILCQNGRLYAFGRRLVVEGAASEEAACEALRQTIVRRMEQRQPFAEEEEWKRLSLLMNAQLNDGDSAKRAAQTAILTIDSM